MNKRLNNIKKSILPYVGSTSPTPSQCYLLFSPFLQWNGVTIIVISAIKLLPVSLCADKSQPYSLLDGLQVNLSIVWQDAAVHFDPPPPCIVQGTPVQEAELPGGSTGTYPAASANYIGCWKRQVRCGCASQRIV